MTELLDFKGWSLTQSGSQIECRKAFSGPAKSRHHAYDEYGQVLLIVSTNGWKFKSCSGKKETRLSMNGPCNMDLDDLRTFVEVADHALSILQKRNK